jgi:serine/threonine protein kinase/tetratricopeptide (TPR) repeat protein
MDNEATTQAQAARAEEETDNALLKRMFERLRADAPGYEFSDKVLPFHSSYDNWHFFGRRTRSSKQAGTDTASSVTSNTSASRPSSIRTRSDYDGVTMDEERERDVIVVARVSKQVLRLEREFKLCQSLQQQTARRRHFVIPLEFFRLPARQPRDVPLCASIVEAPSRNYLRELMEFGPNFYTGTSDSPQPQKREQVELLTFLDFAIGATECLEILHHGNDMVHGEIRGDAFHFNRETHVVRMINFGSGIRSFEHGLSSANWSSLMNAKNVQSRIQFIAPEQTGRLPAEPDARTDLYSCGILFWIMLTGRVPFEGISPLDVMASVLSRKVPFCSSVRPDVPEALSLILSKMTSRNMDDRYNSATGIKHDLEVLKSIFTSGDQEALSKFKVGTADVSCYFILPSSLVGREAQRELILTVIEKAAKKSARAAPISRTALHSLSSSSSLMSGHELVGFEDIASDSTSSAGESREHKRGDSRLIPISEALSHESSMRQEVFEVAMSNRSGSVASSIVSANEEIDMIKPLEKQSSTDSRGSVMTNNNKSNADSIHKTLSNYQLHSDRGGESGSMLRTAQKLKKKGRTELIGICGAAGHGKSALVQSIQQSARKHGYFTSAKFDQVRNSPFDAVVKVMSSLFRQIFSENDVNTPFHDNIRTFVRPFWQILHVYLELPIWLLSPTVDGKCSAGSVSANGSLGTLSERKSSNTASTQDWLRSGGPSNRSSRFSSIFLDVLRLLAVQKFVCFCLDDLQFADPESLDLIQAIVKAHVPIVLILTCQGDDMLSDPMRKLLAKATKVEVGAFTDEDTARFVADTLHRPIDYVTPLVAVIQEKTQGNPFFVREMLDSAHRKRAIYYCWKHGAWEFSMDKLFEHFASPDAYSTNDFVLRRMRDLPVDAQTVLSWAAIIGNSFEFHLIRSVMSCSCSLLVPQPLIPPVSKDAVAGLQVALGSFVVMPTDQEDRFKFSHDRYIAAAETLANQYDRSEMHYVAAASTFKHDPYDPVTKPSKALFEQARHICEGIDAIKRRVKGKAPYRDLLFQAAEAARESGARTSGLHYFQHCLQLLPDDPWDDDVSIDATYAETLTLKTRAAEAFWYNQQYEEASKLLEEVNEHARDVVDKAPVAIILSRMHAQRGDSSTAFHSLKTALAELGLPITDRTWDECDDEFQRLVPLLMTSPPQIEGFDITSTDRTLTTIGAVLTELQSSAYWTDHKLFYNASLTIMSFYLERGLYPQVALGYINLAAIAIWRFSMVTTAVEFGNTAIRLLELFERESYTIGRGLTLHALFLGHVQMEFRDNFIVLNRGLEAASAAGDKILHLLNIGIMVSQNEEHCAYLSVVRAVPAVHDIVLCNTLLTRGFYQAAYRLWSSEDLAEIEAFITSVGEVRNLSELGALS